MLQVSDYLTRAKQCEDIAARAVSRETRDGLLQMAKSWAALAEERERFLEAKGRGGEQSAA